MNAIAQPATAFTFTCCDCGCTEMRPTAEVPDDWDMIRSPSGLLPYLLRCPDCNERIERDHIAARRAESAPSAPPPPPEQPPAFAIFLERQDGGHFAVAMHPEAALMRWLPLGFFLTPDQARTTAKSLIRYATLAENPGALPTSIGEEK